MNSTITKPQQTKRELCSQYLRCTVMSYLHLLGLRGQYICNSISTLRLKYGGTPL